MKKAFGKNDLDKSNFSKRLYVLSFVAIFMFCVILFRLFQIQIVKYEFYKALAQDQHEFFQKTFPRRGEIFIRDKYSKQLYPLAVNKELNLIYAAPKDIKNKKEIAAKLSAILEMEESEVNNIISKPDDPYEVIKNKVQDDMAENIIQEKIFGIGVAPEIFRYYPGEQLAANVVGFVGFEGNKKVGQYGIERYYNSRLEGSLGFLELEKDASGNWISFGLKNAKLPKDGEDIILTIDQTIQYIAEKKLDEAAEKCGAESGNIIIIDPKSGAIIAMAQYPSYNPNEYQNQEDMRIFLNSNVHNVYEPGSIQKPITMAIGIDLKRVNPTTTYIDEGLIKIDGWTISNSTPKKNGKQNMIQVLEKSLNTGAVFVQQEIGKKDFYNYLKNFGLNQTTGIEISGESQGNLSNLETKSDINYATASYGQGISVTPIGMLTAISSFANEGKLMKPHIVEELIRSDGSSEKIEPVVVRQVVSSRTANLISAMMVSVIENGHTKKAKIDGYKFAGKTGTAQVPKKEGGGYEKNKTVHTFVGFGPIPNPRFSILVKLDNPQNGIWAESTVGPVFKELSRELVNYYNIPPTEK